MAKRLGITAGVVLIAVTVVGGCEAGKDIGEGFGGGVRKCYEATESPLRVEWVRGAFRAEGVELFSDPTLCGGEGSFAFGRPVAGLTTTVFAGPFENIADHGEVGRREGQLICRVAARPAAVRDEVMEYRTEKGGAVMLVANLQCGVYGEGDRATAQEAAVRRAVRSLAARVGR